MKNVSWYYNLNLKPQGPLSFEEMRARIHRGEVGPHDLISNDADGSWRPACEWGVFEVTLFPATQAFMQGQDVVEDEKEWVLLVPAADGKGVVQEGPFSVREIREALRNHSVNGQQYIWKSGLSGWCRIQDRPEFAALVESVL
ncbi:DUF4339 domain-containing protein [Bdellovibrio sp. BCCA]|uniref:DUF4339 domain-containing protein n=1 Tax=Bdellovibrio sp. BCCA TaxID=3136281 RepID=UPI0030F11E53